jgi:hypothetical protein
MVSKAASALSAARVMAPDAPPPIIAMERMVGVLGWWGVFDIMALGIRSENGRFLLLLLHGHWF